KKFNNPSGADEYDVFVPLWFLALIAGLVGVATWLQMPPRFSLRTLLIATTLVAVALGLVAIATRYRTVDGPPTHTPPTANRILGCMRDGLPAADCVVGA